MMVVGRAYRGRRTQTSKGGKRETWGEVAGISSLAVCVSDVRCTRFADAIEEIGGPDRTTTMGRTGIEQRFVDEAVAQVAVTASDLVAGREPAQLIMQVCNVAANRDHDVSILITIGDAAGR